MGLLDLEASVADIDVKMRYMSANIENIVTQMKAIFDHFGFYYERDFSLLFVSSEGGDFADSYSSRFTYILESISLSLSVKKDLVGKFLAKAKFLKKLRKAQIKAEEKFLRSLSRNCFLSILTAPPEKLQNIKDRLSTQFKEEANLFLSQSSIILEADFLSHERAFYHTVFCILSFNALKAFKSSSQSEVWEEQAKVLQEALSRSSTRLNSGNESLRERLRATVTSADTAAVALPVSHPRFTIDALCSLKSNDPPPLQAKVRASSYFEVEHLALENDSFSSFSSDEERELALCNEDALIDLSCVVRT